MIHSFNHPHIFLRITLLISFLEYGVSVHEEKGIVFANAASFPGRTDDPSHTGRWLCFDFELPKGASKEPLSEGSQETSRITEPGWAHDKYYIVTEGGRFLPRKMAISQGLYVPKRGKPVVKKRGNQSGNDGPQPRLQQMAAHSSAAVRQSSRQQSTSSTRSPSDQQQGAWGGTVPKLGDAEAEAQPRNAMLPLFGQNPGPQNSAANKWSEKKFRPPTRSQPRLDVRREQQSAPQPQQQYMLQQLKHIEQLYGCELEQQRHSPPGQPFGQPLSRQFKEDITFEHKYIHAGLSSQPPSPKLRHPFFRLVIQQIKQLLEYQRLHVMQEVDRELREILNDRPQMRSQSERNAYRVARSSIQRQYDNLPQQGQQSESQVDQHFLQQEHRLIQSLMQQYRQILEQQCRLEQEDLITIGLKAQLQLVSLQPFGQMPAQLPDQNLIQVLRPSRIRELQTLNQSVQNYLQLQRSQPNIRIPQPHREQFAGKLNELSRNFLHGRQQLSQQGQNLLETTIQPLIMLLQEECRREQNTLARQANSEIRQMPTQLPTQLPTLIQLLKNYLSETGDYRNN